MTGNLIGILVGVAVQKVTVWAGPILKDLVTELKDSPQAHPADSLNSSIVHPYSGDPVIRHGPVEILIASRQGLRECTVIVLYRAQTSRRVFVTASAADRFARVYERKYGVRRRHI